MNVSQCVDPNEPGKLFAIRRMAGAAFEKVRDAVTKPAQNLREAVANKPDTETIAYTVLGKCAVFVLVAGSLQFAGFTSADGLVADGIYSSLKPVIAKHSLLTLNQAAGKAHKVAAGAVACLAAPSAKTVAFVMIGGVVVPVLVMGTLHLAGFSAGGVVANSCAAGIHSYLGPEIAKGSLFALCQSFGECGLGSHVLVRLVVAGGAVGLMAKPAGDTITLGTARL